jgi:ubiquinone/menaquinone biosynthesis C-methylase UbiE
MKFMVNANNLLALFTGSYNDIEGMKGRVKGGYEGEYSPHVQQYDHLGYQFQDRAARVQLEDLRLQDMQILDVGCGTGALAHVAFENGAKAVVCGDISAYMLKQAMVKETDNGKNHSFCQLDAEAVPYKNDSFDAVISGMTFGLLPNQKIAFTEMVRVTKPGGLICVGAHGPEHYWEPTDAYFRSITKRYLLGYRLEWWPRTEKFIRGLFEQANFSQIRSKRIIWRNKFENGLAAYDFFAAISALWWYANFPSDQIEKDLRKTRNYFEKKNINIVTDDIVIAYGYKPYSGI